MRQPGSRFPPVTCRVTSRRVRARSSSTTGSSSDASCPRCAAHRREDALLTLRGATDTQLLRFAVGQGLLAAAVGTVVGLAAAAAGVSWVIGHPVWRDIGAGHLAQTLTLAVGAGAIATAARLVPLRRASRRTAIMAGRRQLRAEWRPAWL